jgi:hypothetical protein
VSKFSHKAFTTNTPGNTLHTADTTIISRSRSSNQAQAGRVYYATNVIVVVL